LKNIIYILIIVFSVSTSIDTFAQDYWIEQSSPTTKYLRSVFFTDTLNGWISGDSGLIIHTSNKGITWTIQPTGLNREVISLFFLNADTGFALSWEFSAVPPNYFGTRILSTINRGVSWNNYLFPDTNLFLNTIYFHDRYNGFMGGSEGKIFYTTNSGINWHRASVDSSAFFSFPVKKIKFADEHTGYAAGGAFDIAGMMWKTTNGGLNWRSVIVGPEPMNDLYIFDRDNIFCAGGDFEYGPSRLITTNGGTNWNYTEFGIFGIGNSIDFRTYNEGWISLGIIDTFLLTTDHGISWNTVSSPDNSRIYDLQFIDQRNGWAVGNEGVILKYNSSIIGVSEYEAGIPEKFILHQNYPNPFNPKTIISYQLSVNSFVKLIIYNVLGKEVATLVNEMQSATSGERMYQVEFDGSELPSGVYFYRLSTDKITTTKKMVLIE